MIASSVMIQPNPSGTANALASAYRQVFYRVKADSFVPPTQPMYADIYVGPTSTFYKTISAYSILTDGGDSVFDFDIQDAAQEYLSTITPVLPITDIVIEDNAVVNLSDYFKVYFRGSSYSGDILVPEGPVPVQGTATTPPTSPYTGLVSNKVLILNSSMRPDYKAIYDNSSPETGIKTYFEVYLKRNQIIAAGLPSATRIYPLSNLPLNPWTGNDLSLCNWQWRDYNGGFPVYVAQFATAPALSDYSRNCTAWLMYGSNGTMTTFLPLTTVAIPVTAGHSYYVPCGLADIQTLISAPDFADLVNVDNSNYYRVALVDEDAETYCFISPMFKVAPTGIETECLWFQNLNGCFEQVTFVRAATSVTTTSAEIFRPYPNGTEGEMLSHDRLTSGRTRYNIRANDDIALTATFAEGLMPWVSELFMSGYILQQFSGAPGGLRAVKITDGSYSIRKTVKDGRVNYEVSIKIRPAIDYIPLRN